MPPRVLDDPICACDGLLKKREFHLTCTTLAVDDDNKDYYDTVLTFRLFIQFFVS